MQKMDEIKSKFRDLLNKPTRIPAMGFSEYFIQTVSGNEKPAADTESGSDATSSNSVQKSDQEVLESIEAIYFQADTADAALMELQKVCDSSGFQLIDETIAKLRKQQKVLSKQVLQNILEKRTACNEEFGVINGIQKELEESLWTCRKARSYLNFAKTNLTTTSLEILASFRKREILKDLLQILNAIKKLKSTDVQVQHLLADCNYSEAIILLLSCKDSADAYMEYNCVQSLSKKLQETLLLTEFQLDTVLDEMVLNFDGRTYAKLMEAYKLLKKSLIAMDQLHINFISTIHSSVNAVLRSYNDRDNADENVKLLYEQLCEQVTAEKYIPCLVSLCKTTWTILASYYQIVIWHQNYKLYPQDMLESSDADIQEKLKKGQSRIWSDILSKICVLLQSSKLKTLKYDQFIQVLSIVQRLKKVGAEFCGAQSEKLIEIMRAKSEEFFQRYHIACLEEICLFIDNESWTVVESVTHILNLPEFRSVRGMLRRQKTPPVAVVLTTTTSGDSPSNNNCDELVSVHSQDGGSSIYGSYGYFLRFSEKSSPFDGGLDSTMLEEDILSGIVDEASCYFSEESDDEQKSLSNKYDDDTGANNPITVNNTTLNVFRCIGRYLQMCKLLHCISPKIVASMLELLDFYAYAVHEIFGKDAPVQMEKFYTEKVEKKLQVVESNVLVNVKIWPLNFSSLINNELANPDTLYGLSQRIVAVECGQSMVMQFQSLQSYLNHLLPISERPILTNYFAYADFMMDIGQPVYTCVTSRVIDLPTILNMMSKVKTWDVNHVSFQHNSYIDVMNRNLQNFAMQLEDIDKEVNLPAERIWNSVAHVATHLLVEGFSNVKKCSAGGRALMQLDFTNFMSYLELLSNRKFPEYRSYVDTFIKAYYFSTPQFEEWLETQMQFEQYTNKQLMNLIQCVCVSDKRTKQKLLNLLGNSVNLNTSNISNNSMSAT